MVTTKKATAAAQWSATETSPGSWEVKHASGRSLSEQEATVVVDALNALRRLRVRIISACLVGGQTVAAGSVLDLPVREAQDLCSNASVAELVPE